MSAMWLKEWSTQFAWFREHGWRGMGRAGAIAAIAVVAPVIVALVAIAVTTSQEPERGPGFALGVESYFTGSAHLEMTWGQHRRVACDYALTMHQRYAEPVDGFDAEEFATGCAGPERGDRDGAPRWRYQWFVSGVDRVDPAPLGRAEADARFAAAIAEDGPEGQSPAMLIESVLDACHQQVNGVPRAQSAGTSLRGWTWTKAPPTPSSTRDLRSTARTPTSEVIRRRASGPAACAGMWPAATGAAAVSGSTRAELDVTYGYG